jgi:hypothetical protein
MPKRKKSQENVANKKLCKDDQPPVETKRPVRKAKTQAKIALKQHVNVKVN